MNTSKKTFGLIAVACTIIGIGLFAGCQKSDGPENPLSGRNLGVRCKSMCLGIDVLKSEEEVFDI